MTGERWDSREQRVDVDARRVWKAHSQPIVTSTAAAFIRQPWLNRVAAGTTNRFWFAETASRDGLATPPVSEEVSASSARTFGSRNRDLIVEGFFNG